MSGMRRDNQPNEYGQRTVTMCRALQRKIDKKVQVRTKTLEANAKLSLSIHWQS